MLFRSKVYGSLDSMNVGIANNIPVHINGNVATKIFGVNGDTVITNDLTISGNGPTFDLYEHTITVGNNFTFDGLFNNNSTNGYFKCQANSSSAISVGGTLTVQNLSGTNGLALIKHCIIAADAIILQNLNNTGGVAVSLESGDLNVMHDITCSNNSGSYGAISFDNNSSVVTSKGNIDISQNSCNGNYVTLFLNSTLTATLGNVSINKIGRAHV